MTYQHQQLADDRWDALPFMEQMANLGSEVERAILWKEKGNGEYSRLAAERALELLDFTLADEKNRQRLKELARLREVLADYFFFENEFASSDAWWRSYFYPFYYAAREGIDALRKRDAQFANAPPLAIVFRNSPKGAGHRPQQRSSPIPY